MSIGSIAATTWNRVTEGTFIHALDYSRLDADIIRCSQRSLFRNCLYAAGLALKNLLLRLVFTHFLYPRQEGGGALESKEPPLFDLGFAKVAVVLPAVEEGLFRGIFQNAVAYLQSTWGCGAARPRVLATNSAFAAAHLHSNSNANGMTALDARLQALGILLFSSESLVYECAGRGFSGLLVPITAHVTNNAACVLLHRYLRAVYT